MYKPEWYYKYKGMTAHTYTEIMHELTTEKRMKKLAKANSSEKIKLINGYIGATCGVKYRLRLEEEDREDFVKEVISCFLNWQKRHDTV